MPPGRYLAFSVNDLRDNSILGIVPGDLAFTNAYHFFDCSRTNGHFCRRFGHVLTGTYRACSYHCSVLRVPRPLFRIRGGPIYIKVTRGTIRGCVNASTLASYAP